ncbi:tetratricopeptide repeat protein [Limnobacter sp.]|uniref:tetratricopeptide repeat protein n=1 Tax=Limnobacter sp. TaxID=2003368 RepID=UPI002FE22C83
MYFAWYGFFSSGWHKTTSGSGLLEKSPEWHALLDRRREIESDPMLDEGSKQTLIENWQTMAQESKPHMDARESLQTSRLTWVKPVALPVLIMGTLILAIAFTYFIGAMNAGSLQWPGRNTDLLNTSSVDQAVTVSSGHPGDGASLEDRLAGLKIRLAQQPDDLRGWVLLARTHASMSNYPDSAAALKKALELSPGHPDILADLADMTAMAQGRKLAGEPETYIAAALQSEPRHEKALALAASAAEQAGDQNKAQVYWQLLSQVQQASLKTAASEAAVDDVLTTVSLVLPQKMPGGVNDNSALFVFMKSQVGAGMPLAVVRVPAGQLQVGQVVRFGPGDFIQEGAMNKLPETVHFQARLSIQGMAQPGDGDVESGWVAVPRSELSRGLSLDLNNGSAR